MNNFVRTVSLILGVKIVINLYYMLLSIYFKSKYETYVTTGEGWGIRERKQSIVKLFTNAGVKDAFVSMVEPAGYGMVQTGNVSVFENIAIRREDIAQIIYGKFKETIFVYRSRIFETINPFYWVETILLLPKVTLTYLGVSGESIFIKIFQILWWLFGIAISIFSNDIRTYLVNNLL